MRTKDPPMPENKKPVHLTNTQVMQFERLVRSLLGMLIGLILTTLFCVVILGVLFLAARSADEQLLNTLLNMMATTLAGVMGWLYGRSSAQK